MESEKPGIDHETSDEYLRSLLSPRGLLARIKEIKHSLVDGWQDYRQWSFNRRNGMPYLDRPAPVAYSPSADGPIGTLSRIELNARRGRPLDEGLDNPDQLNQPGAP